LSIFFHICPYLQLNQQDILYTQATRQQVSGQPETKGGYRQKHDLVISTFTNYLNLSPKNQARQKGEHKPYQGKRNVDLTIKTELTGTYGRPGKNLSTIFINHFF
jgi:hypothetical protein